MENNPIEHKSYLVMRHLMYRIISEPQYAQKLDRYTENLFDGGVAFQHMYSIIKQEYRHRGYKDPIQKEWLRAELAGKLDRLGSDVEERSMFDYVLSDTYTVDNTLESGNSLNRTVSDYIKKIRVTNAIKKVVANELQDNAIDEFIKGIDSINSDTASRELPKPINVLSQDSKQEIVDSMRELLVARTPMALKAYNIATSGGLSKGEMGCIAGSSGTGKSMHLTSIASGYASEGKDVAYFALEELAPRMTHRFYKNVVSLYFQTAKDIVLDAEQKRNLATLRNSAEVFENGTFYGILESLRQSGINFGNIYLIKYLPYEMGISELTQSLEDLTVAQGKNVDVVCIDYPDLMDYDRSAGESEAGGRLYASIRGVGQKYNVIMWVASQLNRTTYGADLKTEAHMEGSYRKQNALEFLGVINQYSEEYENGFTRIYVAKSRNSTSTKGMQVQVTVDSPFGVLRDQTPFEANKHSLIVSSAQDSGSSPSKGSSKPKDAKVADTSNMMTSFRTTAQQSIKDSLPNIPNG